MSIFSVFKEFLKKHKDKIILIIGFLLVAATSFAAGRLSILTKSKPIEIKEENIINNIDNKENLTPENKSESAFIGDINNNKFYPTNSTEAKNIPEENKIWFDSQEEATEQNYILGIEDQNKTLENNNSQSNNLPGKYVGSKNSDKYHLSDSATAKRIKEENKVWFQSKEEAENQGYKPGTSIKE